MKALFVLLCAFSLSSALFGGLTDSTKKLGYLRMYASLGAGNFIKTEKGNSGEAIRKFSPGFEYLFGAEISKSWFVAGLNAGRFDMDVFKKESSGYYEATGKTDKYSYNENYANPFIGFSFEYASVKLGYVMLFRNESKGSLHIRLGSRNDGYASLDIFNSVPMASGGGIFTLGTGFCLMGVYDIFIGAGMGNLESGAGYLRIALPAGKDISLSFTGGYQFTGGAMMFSCIISRAIAL